MLKQHATTCFIIVGMMFVFNGCGNEPARVARVVSNPVVPEHPLRDKFMGTWVDEDGDTDRLVKQLPDGIVVIPTEGNELWDEVVSNVRFEGNDLKYDLVYYYLGAEDFSMSIPEAGIETGADHPFSGVCNSFTLSFMDEDYSRLKMSANTNDLPEPITVILTRVDN